MKPEHSTSPSVPEMEKLDEVVPLRVAEGTADMAESTSGTASTDSKGEKNEPDMNSPAQQRQDERYVSTSWSSLSSRADQYHFTLNQYGSIICYVPATIVVHPDEPRDSETTGKICFKAF